MEISLKKTERVRHFIRGFRSIFDMSGKNFIGTAQDEDSGFRRDYLALLGDWEALGNDMRKAINRVKCEN
jgi:hypothetical protein